MSPGPRTLASIAALLLLVAACTQEPEFDLPDLDIDPATEAPAASTPPPADAPALPDAPGRIAVLDDLGTLVTVAPDGSDSIVLAESVEGETIVRQPTWSPDGRRVAWVRFDAEGAGPNMVVTSLPDGTDPTEASTTVIPFYLSWDPTSSRIAYLGSSPTAEIELGVVDVARGVATPLDAGTPFYLSWNPTGEQLLVHVDRERLDRLEVGGASTRLNDRPGSFDTPVWTSDGRSLLYALRTSNGQRLVAHDLHADRDRELVRFDGAITFVVSPDGRRVAYQVVTSPSESAPLVVLDRDTGAVETVTDGFVPAYFWSPEGDRLLYVFPDLATQGAWFRWGVWDGATSFASPRFVPTEVFARDYLQFFQQYAQSMSLWAPDGSAFTYAGTNEAGETGVWVQPVRPDATPVLVTAGVFAAWSAA